MTKSELESMHISELHSLAADAGVERYRMLRREDLIGQLLEKGDDSPGESESKANGGDRDRERSRRERAGKTRERGSREGRERRTREGRTNGEGRRKRRSEDGRTQSGKTRDEDTQDDGAERTVSGRLEITADGEGIVHVGDGEKVSVSAAQIRRCELRGGDLVEGPARSSRRGEKRSGLVRVESVNGAAPVEGRGPVFEQLTPVTPTRRIPLKTESNDLVTRAADLLAPLAFGQRLLVKAQRHSGRTTLLRGLASAILAANESARVVVLLVDERPEEVTEWQRRVPGAEIVDAGADRRASDQVSQATLALEAAKRQAEAGEDVILAIDSLTRLAVAAGDPSAVKPFFGAGRDLAESGAGSLTVIGVVLGGDEDGDNVERAIKTTESATLELSAELAAEGTVPSLARYRPSVAGEELLREGDVLAAARRLRSELSLLPPVEAARRLAERLTATGSNEELLS